MTIRPRRSVLYMPGSNSRALEKAKTLAVDGVILDLEDSVAPETKEAARQQVVDAVKAGGFGRREVFIRVNGVDSPWHAEDLSAAAHAAPDAILVPKVSSADTLELIGRRLLDMGTDHKTRVWAMIETPLAIFNVLSIAAAARDLKRGCQGLSWGPTTSPRTRVPVWCPAEHQCWPGSPCALPPLVFTESIFSTVFSTILATSMDSRRNACKASNWALMARR